MIHSDKKQFVGFCKTKCALLRQHSENYKVKQYAV